MSCLCRNWITAVPLALTGHARTGDGDRFFGGQCAVVTGSADKTVPSGIQEMLSKLSRSSLKD